MELPLGEADKEARPAMPGPEGLRHVFRCSLEYVGLLGIIFWCLGAVLVIIFQGYADKETRSAFPFLDAFGAVFSDVLWSTWGFLGLFHGVLG